MKLKKCLSWRRSDYLLGIFDIRLPFCETKSIIFFLHAFLRKQRYRLHHEWCSSLYLKFVKKGAILSTFFPSKRDWERDYNLPSWAQHYFKKSFLALENRTFRVKLKVTKIVNNAGHYNSFFFFFCLRILRHNIGCRLKNISTWNWLPYI